MCIRDRQRTEAGPDDRGYANEIRRNGETSAGWRSMEGAWSVKPAVDIKLHYDNVVKFEISKKLYSYIQNFGKRHLNLTPHMDFCVLFQNLAHLYFWAL